MDQSDKNDIRIARNVSASLKAEGFHVSASTRKDCIAVASGEQSADLLVRKLLDAHYSKTE